MGYFRRTTDVQSHVSTFSDDCIHILLATTRKKGADEDDDDLPTEIPFDGNPEEFFFNNMKEDAASDFDFDFDTSAIPFEVIV